MGATCSHFLLWPQLLCIQLRMIPQICLSTKFYKYFLSTFFEGWTSECTLYSIHWRMAFAAPRVLFTHLVIHSTSPQWPINLQIFFTNIYCWIFVKDIVYFFLGVVGARVYTAPWVLFTHLVIHSTGHIHKGQAHFRKGT